MPFAVTLFLFLLGAVLVIKGGDLFVDAAAAIAAVFRIPAFVIGATVVSVATTLPEMLVSIMAALEGKVDMAIGNAIGSVTANTAMILAVSILFLPITVPRKNYKMPCLLLAAAAGVLWLCCLSGSLTLWGSLTMLLFCSIFLHYNITSAGRMSTPAEETHKSVWPFIFHFLAGAGGILIGSELLVHAGSRIAQEMGVPERIIAVSLIAVGTSLPELVTTIAAIAKKETSLGIGNVIGANILDLTLILPLCNLFSGKQIPVSALSLHLDFPVCFGAVLLAILPMLIKERTYKWQGAILLLGYCGYMVFLFCRK